MDFLQNLMARHQTELTQPQAAISQGGLPSASKIVEPRQKLRFEGSSEPLMHAADNNQTAFSDSLMSQVDGTYHRPQTTPAFAEFDIGQAIHREMPDEKQNSRPQHSAGISSDTLLGTLNVPQNNQQDYKVGNEPDHKNSGLHVAIDSIGKILEGIDRLPSTSRMQKEAYVVQPARQLDSQLDFQSNNPQGWRLDTGHSSAEMMQNSAQSGADQDVQKRAQNKQYSAQNAWAVNLASSPASLSNSGSLQTPDWLNQIQADLQDRWQALNQKAQAEPVINVTIGRVEVRAVQADSAPARKKNTFPSGVMTLDSYLKQRDRKGGI